MNGLRRCAIAMLASAMGLIGTLNPAQAQGPAWPTRSVRLVVPFPPGGPADAFARLIGEYLSHDLGQPFVIDNRAGAGGQIGSDLVAKAPADGYTLLIVTVGHAVNPSLYSKLPYDTLHDFAPVARVADLPSVLVVNPDLPARSVQELVALMRAKPGAISYGSAGNATTSHVAGAMFTAMAKVDALHVPYKGSAPALTDLMSGQIQMLIDPVQSSTAYVKAGKLRALAVSSAQRTPLVPELPTIAEGGLPGYDFSAWFLLLAPGKTPRDIVDKLNRETTRILAMPEVKERLAQQGAVPGRGSPGEIQAFITSEIKRFATVVHDANMKVD